MFEAKQVSFGGGFNNQAFEHKDTDVGVSQKCVPPESHYSMDVNGVWKTINTRHQRITAMSEYQSKSLEEFPATTDGFRFAIQHQTGISNKSESVFNKPQSSITSQFTQLKVSGLFRQNESTRFHRRPAAMTNVFNVSEAGRYSYRPLFGKDTIVTTGFQTQQSNKLIEGIPSIGNTQTPRHGKSVFNKPQSSNTSQFPQQQSKVSGLIGQYRSTGIQTQQTNTLTEDIQSLGNTISDHESSHYSFPEGTSYKVRHDTMELARKDYLAKRKRKPQTAPTAKTGGFSFAKQQRSEFVFNKTPVSTSSQFQQQQRQASNLFGQKNSASFGTTAASCFSTWSEPMDTGSIKGTSVFGDDQNTTMFGTPIATSSSSLFGKTSNTSGKTARGFGGFVTIQSLDGMSNKPLFGKYTNTTFQTHQTNTFTKPIMSLEGTSGNTTSACEKLIFNKTPVSTSSQFQHQQRQASHLFGHNNSASFGTTAASCFSTWSEPMNTGTNEGTSVFRDDQNTAMFGTPVATPSSSLFGKTNNTFGKTARGFGGFVTNQSSDGMSNKPLFGKDTNTTFQTQQTNTFAKPIMSWEGTSGNTTSAGEKLIFNKTPVSTSSQFQQQQRQASNLFGHNNSALFGTTAASCFSTWSEPMNTGTNEGTSVFGDDQNTAMFGTPVATPSSSLFGKTNNTFGKTARAFGGFVTNQSSDGMSNKPLFGKDTNTTFQTQQTNTFAKPIMSLEGTSGNTTSACEKLIFNKTPVSTSSQFQHQQRQASHLFGHNNSASFGTTAASCFSTWSEPMNTGTNEGTSVFRDDQNTAMFGTPVATPSSSLFGKTNNTFGKTARGFGGFVTNQSSDGMSNKPLFGKDTNTTFQTQQTNTFAKPIMSWEGTSGNTTSAGEKLIFNKTPVSTSSQFQQQQRQASNLFGHNNSALFGTTAASCFSTWSEPMNTGTNEGTSVFGDDQNTAMFGTPVATPSSSLFGKTNNTFGKTARAFGGFVTNQSSDGMSNKPLFGKDTNTTFQTQQTNTFAKPIMSWEGTSGNTTSAGEKLIFNKTPVSTSSQFQHQQRQSSHLFGHNNSASFGTTAASCFSTWSEPMNTGTIEGTSVFGDDQNTTMFGTPIATSSSSLFGKTSNTSGKTARRFGGFMTIQSLDGMSNKPLFGKYTNTTFQTHQTNTFTKPIMSLEGTSGNTTSAGEKLIFNKTPVSTSSQFQQQQRQASNLFRHNNSALFGITAASCFSTWSEPMNTGTNEETSVFGDDQNTAMFGTPVATPSSSLFGKTNNTFGKTARAFGGFVTNQSSDGMSNKPLFGKDTNTTFQTQQTNTFAKPIMSWEGTSGNTTSAGEKLIFNKTPVSTSSQFQHQQRQSSHLFGHNNSASFGTTAASCFSTWSEPMNTGTIEGTSVFGDDQNTTMFGTPIATSSSSLFGKTSNTSGKTARRFGGFMTIQSLDGMSNKPLFGKYTNTTFQTHQTNTFTKPIMSLEGTSGNTTSAGEKLIFNKTPVSTSSQFQQQQRQASNLFRHNNSALFGITAASCFSTWSEPMNTGTNEETSVFGDDQNTTMFGTPIATSSSSLFGKTSNTSGKTARRFGGFMTIQSLDGMSNKPLFGKYTNTTFQTHQTNTFTKPIMSLEGTSGNTTTACEKWIFNITPVSTFSQFQQQQRQASNLFGQNNSSSFGTTAASCFSTWSEPMDTGSINGTSVFGDDQNTTTFGTPISTSSSSLFGKTSNTSGKTARGFAGFVTNQSSAGMPNKPLFGKDTNTTFQSQQTNTFAKPIMSREGTSGNTTSACEKLIFNKTRVSTSSQFQQQQRQASNLFGHNNSASFGTTATSCFSTWPEPMNTGTNEGTSVFGDDQNIGMFGTPVVKCSSSLFGNTNNVNMQTARGFGDCETNDTLAGMFRTSISTGFQTQQTNTFTKPIMSLEGTSGNTTTGYGRINRQTKRGHGSSFTTYRTSSVAEEETNIAQIGHQLKKLNTFKKLQDEDFNFGKDKFPKRIRHGKGVTAISSNRLGRQSVGKRAQPRNRSLKERVWKGIKWILEMVHLDSLFFS